MKTKPIPALKDLSDDQLIKDLTSMSGQEYKSQFIRELIDLVKQDLEARGINVCTMGVHDGESLP